MGRESACDLFYRLPCVLAMESECHSVSLRNRRLGVRTRLVDPDATLKSKIVEFVRSGSYAASLSV
jgi:hypothetical protein